MATKKLDCGHKYKNGVEVHGKTICYKCYRKINKSKEKNYESTIRGTLSLICGYLGIFLLIVTAIVFLVEYFSLVDVEGLYLFSEMVGMDIRMEEEGASVFFRFVDVLFPTLAVLLGWKGANMQINNRGSYLFIKGKFSPALRGSRMGIYNWFYLVGYWFANAIFRWIMDVWVYRIY